MTIENAPLVSILIRSMDRPTLDRAIASAVAQTWPNLEIVVAAACGPTHRELPTQQNGRDIRLIIRDGKLPRSEAANVALESARGDWLNFLDDDDELLPHHVETLMKAPRPNDEHFIFSSTRVIDTQGKTLGHISHAGNHVQLFFHSRATTCASLFHRTLVDEGVRFDPEFDVHEDHDFQVACATRTDFVYVPAATCVWNAQIGESGCGFGGNDDKSQRQRAVTRVRQKWPDFFRRWLTDFDAVLFTGQMYLKGRDYPSARDCLERALALRPDDINALNLCGMANHHCGQNDRAELLLTHALQRLPTHRALQENLELIRAAR